MLSLVLLTLVAIPVCISAAVSDDYDTLYPYYKMVEEAVTSDPKNLYLLRQTFLPVLTTKPWLLDGIHNIRIIIHMDYDGNSSDKQNRASFKRDWEFRWTDSSLLSLVSPDELLAFDPVFYSISYSSIMHTNWRKTSFLPIQLKDNSSSIKNVTDIEGRVKKAFMLFLSWVSQQ